MGKRANNQTTSKSINKKARVDPIIASIAHVITQAEHLPDRCRTMLVDMLPVSLAVPSDKRHEVQAWAVGAMEQTLNAHKSALEAAIAAEDVKLAALKSSEVGLVSTVEEAQAALEAQEAVVQKAECSVAVATDAANSASSVFSTAQAEQTEGAATLARATEEKAALEMAFEAHFQGPMQEGSSPHFKELQSFLKHIEMDSSLLKALPSSCAKSKADRGSFDEVVLKELEKALTSKIAALGAVVAAETPASVERDAAVHAAESDSNVKTVAQKQAADACEAAKTDQSGREVAVTNARTAVEEFQPQVEAITELLETAKAALASFEAGPLNGFMTYKNRVDVSPEAACVGA